MGAFDVSQSRHARRLAAATGAAEGGVRRRSRAAGPAAPPASTAAGRVVQLELRCQPEVLLSRAEAREEFRGGTAEDAWADFIEPFFPGGATFLTLSYSDEGGERFKAYRPAAVFGDIQRFLTKRGYDGPAFFVTEEHRYRRVLHAHGLVHAMDKRDRLNLMAMWEHQRGYARALPATAGAFPYVCKYALKGSDARGDCLDLRHLTGFVPHVRGKRS